MTKIDEQKLSDFSRCVKIVLQAPSDKNLAELAIKVGLDPSSDFVGLDLSGYRLDNQDLSNFNFSGCDLRGTGIARERSREWPKILGARLDEDSTISSDRAAIISDRLANLEAAIEDKRIFSREREHRLRSYFRIVRGTGRSHSEKALKFLAAQGIDAPPFWDENFYELLHECGRWQHAETYCAKFHDAQVTNIQATVKYAHILGVHTHKRDLALAILASAANLHPQEINIPYMKAEIFGHTEGFEKRALEVYEELLRNKNLSEFNRPQVILSIVKLAARTKLGGKIAVKYLRRLNFNLLAERDLNEAAWYMYEMNYDLPKALTLAEEAFSIERTSLAKIHTYFCILIRMGNWQSALPLFDEWAANVTVSELVEGWKYFILPIADAIYQGHGLDLLEITSHKAKEQRQWHSINAAIELAITKVHPNDVRKIDEEVSALLQQITQCISKNLLMENISWPGYDHVDNHH